MYFVDHKVRNFYSVSISGYHIAEAGANPISQLAFTLSSVWTASKLIEPLGALPAIGTCLNCRGRRMSLPMPSPAPVWGIGKTNAIFT
ncbi:MAG: hypothetical protein HKP21_10080 [Xanthomonadales bacterium]|nr:hypothetical protein [Gammaproteobacteria bacterium]MBT8074043.1 hypothetical protein [Gammaproteobacteria bacterium]NNK04893.1 hypothetical protein [Xanthomonadales bacterium]NNL00035.1 hypothetical protein [Xanthomonadales bacterium]